MMCTSPLATPMSSAAVAPNSKAASSSRMPSVSSSRWKKPPPPKIITASRNGLSRLAKPNSTTGLPLMNGMVRPAEKATFLSAKTPTVAGGRPMLRPALMPGGLSIRSMLTPSPNTRAG